MCMCRCTCMCDYGAYDLVEHAIVNELKSKHLLHLVCLVGGCKCVHCRPKLSTGTPEVGRHWRWTQPETVWLIYYIYNVYAYISLKPHLYLYSYLNLHLSIFISVYLPSLFIYSAHSLLAGSPLVIPPRALLLPRQRLPIWSATFLTVSLHASPCNLYHHKSLFCHSSQCLGSFQIGFRLVPCFLNSPSCCKGSK